MQPQRWEIALYGKGGIGKSTISANLSAALAESGKRVIQIGCDPKHDSTRLLMGGKTLPTVLEYLKSTPKEQARAADVLGEGVRGIGCIEAGGPQPGVGCAGRGIISAFEFLERDRIKERYDVIVYDVLGDVVCGGFAVPIRREYADAIFLVTSGEYMALYAANNILRGVRNFDGDRRRRVAGIIFNRRNVAGEELRVERFAKAVRLPVCAAVPRSDAFARAEERKCTVMELADAKAEQAVFAALAEKIGPDMPLYEALPMTDEELEVCVLGLAPAKGPSPLPLRPGSVAPAAQSRTPERRAQTAAAPDPGRPPLYGCAFNGAATAAVHLTDAVVIAHSPRSCAFYTWQNISSPGRRNLFNRGILMPSAISPNFVSTEIDGHDVVFGGIDRLRGRVAEALAKKPGAVIVISSCVSGIIGDDVLSLEELSTPETPVMVIPADGDVNGDYMTGLEMCLHTVARRLIRTDAPPRPMSVNLIGEAGVSNNTDVSFRTVSALLESMGIAVNCRFLGDATVKDVENLLSAPLNVLAVDSPDNRRLKGWLQEQYGCRFFDRCLPVGFRETRQFLEELGDYFGCSGAVKELLHREEARFAAQAAELRSRLSGKRAVLTTINANMDWLLDAAEAVGLEFSWIGVLNYLHTEMKITDDPRRAASVEEIADWPAVTERIAQLKPDIVLSNYTSAVPEGDYITDNMPMTQQAGFYSGLDMMERWAQLLENRREGAWQSDRVFFEKYFA